MAHATTPAPEVWILPRKSKAHCDPGLRCDVCVRHLPRFKWLPPGPPACSQRQSQRCSFMVVLGGTFVYQRSDSTVPAQPSLLVTLVEDNDDFMIRRLP